MIFTSEHPPRYCDCGERAVCTTSGREPICKICSERDATLGIIANRMCGFREPNVSIRGGQIDWDARLDFSPIAGGSLKYLEAMLA